MHSVHGRTGLEYSTNAEMRGVTIREDFAIPDSGDRIRPHDYTLARAPAAADRRASAGRRTAFIPPHPSAPMSTTTKLNSGADMPYIGLGTWVRRKAVFCVQDQDGTRLTHLS